MTAQLLIQSNGEPLFGIFDHPISKINVSDFQLLTPFGKPANRWQQWFGFNQFQYFGVISDELILGCAIADTKLVGAAFCYLYRPQTGEMLAYSLKSPFAHACQFAVSPDTGNTTFVQGKQRIDMINQPQPKSRYLEVSLPKHGLKINCHFSERDSFAPMRICTKTGVNGWVYAQKAAGIPVEGTIECQWGTFDLAALGACAHHDYSSGYMRRETFWNWGCLSGRTNNGQLIGLNVSCGVNETGFTENCFWLNGQLHKVDTVAFNYQKQDLFQPWRLQSYDGKVDLTFTPLGKHAECLNLWLMASNFHQLFGHFNGHLETVGGEKVAINNMLGFVEDHYAKW
ncbi:DUF2804 domain-containing protein [Spartinivicinus poritis]|uniref:DUF2804 domain-containing protein n=1 Tax=Spartinivicinus poritis TaxID=2994640 RepID=A0ABT5U7M0_9GAMM|nr:DUF2804 domain-containing protein [Spartinivicinus sp. A2-2]MDE1462317.1 DUF2804 domain-containing protein [Spartinivicinus sp. A2-2]